MSKKPKTFGCVPGEANRDKHINFVANERTETDRPKIDRWEVLMVI